MIDVSKLAQLSAIQQYTADEVIFSEGDPGSEMYLILSGSVEVSINSPEGFPLPIAVLGPGDFFGEMSLLEGLPRSATVQTLKVTQLVVVDQAHFEQFIALEPVLALRILQGLSGRLRKQNEEIRLIKKLTSGVQLEQLKESEQTKLVNIDFSKDIYPLNHKQYLGKAPAIHQQFLFDRNINCPVCDANFKVRVVRPSKLRLERTDSDFRQYYRDFEPLWYMVWVCPYCYYANFSYDFPHVLPKWKGTLLRQLPDLQTKLAFEFSSDVLVDEVFTAYYMVLYCLAQGNGNPVKKANTWLRLSWLYQDVQDDQMAEFASRQALTYCEQAYYHDRSAVFVEDGQRLCYLIGELNVRLGQYDEALRHFRKATEYYFGFNNIHRRAKERIEVVEQLLV